MAPAAKPLAYRLMKHITVGDDCWEWQGFVRPNGYAAIRADSNPKGKHLMAHRAMYELLVGPIPDGLQLDHLCRNRRCVRPDHLEPVTCQENTLRGVGVTARNATKTHCVHGHRFDEANTYHHAGKRQCRACCAEKTRRRRQSRRTN